MASDMTSPEETKAALQALRFTEARNGDRLQDHDVAHYLRSTRQAVTMIEGAIRENWHPEMNGNREQLLAVLRPHVAWLDANPAADPQIKDARALPTSVLAEVLRERLDIAPDLASHIREIAARLVTQDNRATDRPIFIVQEKRRTYGFDPDYGADEEIAWRNAENDYEEADAEEHARLEALYDAGEKVPGAWTRTAYQDTWEYVTACFTEAGCAEYIRVNKHNHRGELRIYAATSWRNAEFRAVRDLLVALAGGAL